jgi:hypothetical protein
MIKGCVKGNKNGKETENDEKPTALNPRPTDCDGRDWVNRCALNDHLFGIQLD